MTPAGDEGRSSISSPIRAREGLFTLGPTADATAVTLRTARSPPTRSSPGTTARTSRSASVTRSPLGPVHKTGPADSLAR